MTSCILFNNKNKSSFTELNPSSLEENPIWSLTPMEFISSNGSVITLKSGNSSHTLSNKVSKSGKSEAKCYSNYM